MATISGVKSISEMTDEELREELRKIRTSRRTPPPKTYKTGERKKKESNPLEKITPEMAAMLLEKLGGSNETD